MISTFWSLLAAFAAVTLEYLYRTLNGSWWHNLPFYVPLQLVISFCIYKLVTVPGQPLIGALIVWSFAIIVTRLLVTVVLLRDHVSPGVWAAVILMVAARVVQQTWR